MPILSTCSHHSYTNLHLNFSVSRIQQLVFSCFIHIMVSIRLRMGAFAIASSSVPSGTCTQTSFAFSKCPSRHISAKHPRQSGCISANIGTCCPAIGLQRPSGRGPSARHSSVTTYKDNSNQKVAQHNTGEQHLSWTTPFSTESKRHQQM